MLRLRYLISVLAVLILAGCASQPKPPASNTIPITFPTIHGS